MILFLTLIYVGVLAVLIKMVFSCKWLFENVEANELYKLAAVKILKERNAHPRNSYGLSVG